MESEEKVIEELNREKEELDKKVDRIMGSFDYYGKLVEDLGNMFKEYEISENVVCLSSCLIDDTSLDNISSNLGLNYVVKVLNIDDNGCNNLFQFNAVNFEDKDTKFEVTIYKNDKQETKYYLNTFDDIKSNIIKWLISM